MKTSKILTWALLLSATTLSMTACSDDDEERTPEIVTDPLAENVAYYIVGRTMEGTTPLSGVTVSVDGQESVETDNSGLFRISVNGKQTYTVKATKDNYLGMTATVSIPNNAENRSSVTANFVLTPKATTATLPANNNEAVIDETGEVETIASIEEAGIQVPANKVETNTDVTVTPYLASNSATTSIMNMYIETSNEVQANAIKLAVRNASSQYNFTNVEVYKESDMSRAESQLGEAVYNTETQTYQYELQEGTLEGDYSFRIDAARQESGEQSEPIKDAENTVDNSGNFNAMNNVTINYSAPMGWEYVTAPESTVGNDPICEQINNAIVASEGPQGVYNVNYSEQTSISGNHILYWNVESTYKTINYTFNLNNGQTVTVTVKKYTGTKFDYRIENANGHSGGGSQIG